MKLLLVMLCSLFFFFNSFAQNELSVDGSEDINKVLPDSIKFQYPEFVNSIVNLKDETYARASLNYNYVIGDVQFIDIKGDTLSVANEGTIKFIKIEADTFYFDKVWLQLLTANGKIKLAKRETYSIGDIRKKGAYGQLSSTGGISIINSLSIKGRVSALSEGINTTLVKKVVYYFGDNYNHFMPATKKNCFKIFGNKENTLQNYFEANKVDFNNEAELKKLIASVGAL